MCSVGAARTHLWRPRSDPALRCAPARVDRLERNAAAFYQWHVCLAPRTCYGFSGPSWDLLFDTMPADAAPHTLGLVWRLPLPFVAFLASDDLHKRLAPRLAAYWRDRAAPPAPGLLPADAAERHRRALAAALAHVPA